VPNSGGTDKSRIGFNASGGETVAVFPAGISSSATGTALDGLQRFGATPSAIQSIAQTVTRSPLPIIPATMPSAITMPAAANSNTPAVNTSNPLGLSPAMAALEWYGPNGYAWSELSASVEDPWAGWFRARGLPQGDPSLAGWFRTPPAGWTPHLDSVQIPAIYAGGFANGGSFIVPPGGGTDGTFVGLHTTGGERVSVDTPAQQRQGGGDINVTMHITGVTDAKSLILNEKQIMTNFVRAFREAEKTL
jgi:hypothetical protein